MDLDTELAVVVLLDVLEFVCLDEAVRKLDAAEELLVVLLLELAVK